MSIISKISITIAVSILANVVSFYVLVHNAEAGIYSPDADTIMIPIMGNTIVSSVVVILLVGCVSFTRPRKLVSSIGLLLGIVATFLSISYALHWAIPNHYMISVSFGVLSVVSFTLAYFAFRSLASNQAFKWAARVGTRK
jgi:hypothetical protein